MGDLADPSLLELEYGVEHAGFSGKACVSCDAGRYNPEASNPESLGGVTAELGAKGCRKTSRGVLEDVGPNRLVASWIDGCSRSDSKQHGTWVWVNT